MIYPRYTSFYLYPRQEDVSLLFFEWEKNILEMEGKKMGIKLKVIPGHISFDKEDRCIIFTWMMGYKVCPFFNGECAVYEKRPLVCQSYPILETNFLKPGNLTFSTSSLCPHIVSADRADIRTLHQMYGSSLEGAIKKESAKIWIDALFNRLHQHDILSKKVYTRKKVLEAYQKNTHIGILEYFIEKNLMSRNTIDAYIKKIENTPHMLFDAINVLADDLQKKS